MNKKVMKVLSILLVAMMVMFSLSQFVFATGDTLNPGQFTVSTGAAGVSSVQNVIGNILSIVQVVAIGVAVIMLIVLAIKYISAAPSEKAEIKKSATIYIVGAVLLFSASGILAIIKEFATNIKAS